MCGWANPLNRRLFGRWALAPDQSLLIDDRAASALCRRYPLDRGFDQHCHGCRTEILVNSERSNNVRVRENGHTREDAISVLGGDSGL